MRGTSVSEAIRSITECPLRRGECIGSGAPMSRPNFSPQRGGKGPARRRASSQHLQSDGELLPHLGRVALP